MNDQELFERLMALLKMLVETPSLSREEDQTANIIEKFFKDEGISTRRIDNNIWCTTDSIDPSKPTILLNSHHDTVKPVAGWVTDPFEALIEGDKLTGLGSNDAGGPLITLIGTFLKLKQHALPYNLILAATAEEEISGKNGVELIMPELGKIDLGIVGEPTGMKMAVAEKGLMVLDGTAYGKSGHAARREGENAIYLALEDIVTLQGMYFDKGSPLLGPTILNVTQIEAGTQHNVVPDRCTFVIDVRVNELYTNEEVFELIKSRTRSELKARSFRLGSSMLPASHPIALKARAEGLETIGSATLSDQALMRFPTFKMGPGESSRSHTAGEHIYLSEIRDGLKIYYELLKDFQF